MREESVRQGIVYGVVAYALWGLFPLYWAMLRDAPSTEVLAHRILGSFVFLGAILLATGRLRELTTLGGRQWSLLAVASVLVTVNWLTYIWGVQHEHVVETSLGYFINPLVTVALGVGVLGERLRRGQIAALALAAVAVAALTVEFGRPPWIALALAVTFAIYGLVKKQAAAPPIASVFVETAFVALPAFAWLVHLRGIDGDTFLRLGRPHDALLLGAGAVTALPLVAFAAATNRVPLVALGLLQYLAPSLQFLCGVVLLREAVSPARWAGFGLVWVALLVFTADAVANRPR